MWTNETIFSLGDISNGIESEAYRNFVQTEYEYGYVDRLEHVKLMIERLQAEKTMIEKSVSF